MASAEAYDAHIGRYGGVLAEALLDRAGVRPGVCALDVGCGPGALTGALAPPAGGCGPRCTVASARPTDRSPSARARGR